MKAVITEINNKYAIALNNRGQFIRVKNRKDFRVGYEVDITPHSGVYSGSAARIISLAAALLIIFGAGSYSYCYSLPYSYIDIDINPSIEITANMFNKIIKVEALNNDAKGLISLSAVKNRKIGDGIGEILRNAVNKGYIANDGDSTVIFTIASKNSSKVGEIKSLLYPDLMAGLEQAGKNTDVVVAESTVNIRDDARKLGISPGKLNIIEKLIKEKPGVKAADLKNKSVKEIVKEIKAVRQERKAGKKVDGFGKITAGDDVESNNAQLNEPGIKTDDAGKNDGTASGSKSTGTVQSNSDNKNGNGTNSGNGKGNSTSTAPGQNKKIGTAAPTNGKKSNGGEAIGNNNSDGNKNGSGGNKNSSGGHENNSDGNKNSSGGDKKPAAGAGNKHKAGSAPNVNNNANNNSSNVNSSINNNKNNNKNNKKNNTTDNSDSVDGIEFWEIKKDEQGNTPDETVSEPETMGSLAPVGNADKEPEAGKADISVKGKSDNSMGNIAGGAGSINTGSINTGSINTGSINASSSKGTIKSNNRTGAKITGKKTAKDGETAKYGKTAKDSKTAKGSSKSR